MGLCTTPCGEMLAQGLYTSPCGRGLVSHPLWNEAYMGLHTTQCGGSLHSTPEEGRNCIKCSNLQRNAMFATHQTHLVRLVM